MHANVAQHAFIETREGADAVLASSPGGNPAPEPGQHRVARGHMQAAGGHPRMGQQRRVMVSFGSSSMYHMGVTPILLTTARWWCAAHRR